MFASFFEPLVRNIRTTFSGRSPSWDAGVFFAYLLSAKLAQYILYDLHTSPALIWAPTGIAVAAVLLRGSNMWLPIACAYFLAILTLPGFTTPLGMVIATVGFTAQPLIGAWGLKSFGSDGTVHKTRDVVVLVVGAFIIAAIGPLVNTAGQMLLHTLNGNVWLSFSRAWAGGVLGIMVLTPLITGWYYSPFLPFERKQWFEVSSAFVMLAISTFLLFWTTLSNSLIFLLILFLCVALFWIALRFGSRVTVSAITFFAVFGIMGSILINPGIIPLNEQLFADELFIILIAPIFFVFFTVSEERRITQRELAQKIKELEQMTERLSSDDKVKNEFIAILAHELRNPLAAIVTTLEIMRLGEADPERIHTIESAELQARVMRRLLDDLLDVARVTQKKFKLIKMRSDVRELLQRSVVVTEEIMRNRNHTVTVSLPSQPVWLDVDPVRFEQILLNLLENAAKYTNPGGRIALSLRTQKNGIVITIQDNGIGIPPEELGNIFLPFRQLQDTLGKGSGLGIGLSLTKRLVEMHGGEIEVASGGHGHGSTFTVRLYGAEHAVPSRVQRALPAQPIRPSGLTILIVDDNKVVARGLAELLEHRGQHTMLAHTGSEALAIAAKLQPQLVLLDIGLPDIDGYEVARQLRQHMPGKLTLAALTGYGQEQDKQQAYEAGFDYHLVKPVSIAEIEQIINSV